MPHQVIEMSLAQLKLYHAAITRREAGAALLQLQCAAAGASAPYSDKPYRSLAEQLQKMTQ